MYWRRRCWWLCKWSVICKSGYGAFPAFDYTFRTATCGGTYTYDPGALSGAVQTVSPAVTTTYTVTGTSLQVVHQPLRLQLM
ncbi:MAG: hypothetical protein IPO02_12215 [Bacteroidetes bacterium]|nr:hypothetical protein [Bacteroidota bacterium]